MVSTELFYPGASYPMESEYLQDDSIDYNQTFFGPNARTPAGSIGVTVPANTANQLKAVSDKISTGVRTIELQGTMPEVLESIPDQHLEEINRLRKLTGTDLTFHGPLIEPTGVTRNGWDPEHRIQAERQMWSAVQRAHKVDPDGNVVVTFHSSNGLPDPEQRVWDPELKREVVKEMLVMDERTGQFTQATPRKDYLTGKQEDPKEALAKQNKETWFRELQHINFNISAGMQDIKGRASSLLFSNDKDEERAERKGNLKERKEEMLNLYKDFVKNPEKAEKFENELSDGGKAVYRKQMNSLVHGDIYLRESYQGFKKLFDQAYFVAEQEENREDLKRLNKLKERFSPIINELEEDPSKVEQLGDNLTEGVNVLRSLNKAPEVFKPAKDFAIDKASETFANLALKSHNEFGDSAPIISIENPPAGMGLSRGEELRDLVKASHEKFVKKAQKEGMSEEKARKEAEKLIGVTWDVGHINMIRKFGFDEDKLAEETGKVAPYVKHVHLSDNFGMEHTELPMGMGNVPMQKHIKKLKEQYGEKYDKIKKIIETGNWYQHFQTSPLPQTLQAFGSPVYSMKMGPYWNQLDGQQGAYGTGFGQMLPDQHFQMYGAGFSQLPVELGGQMSGGSRVSGKPME